MDQNDHYFRDILPLSGSCCRRCVELNAPEHSSDSQEPLFERQPGVIVRFGQIHAISQVSAENSAPHSRGAVAKDAFDLLRKGRAVGVQFCFSESCRSSGRIQCEFRSDVVSSLSLHSVDMDDVPEAMIAGTGSKRRSIGRFFDFFGSRSIAFKAERRFAVEFHEGHPYLH